LHGRPIARGYTVTSSCQVLFIAKYIRHDAPGSLNAPSDGYPGPAMEGNGRVNGLFPSCIDGLADQQGRVRAAPRTQLLRSAVADLGDVQVAFLIHADAVGVE
jgi:hypothetical protein